MNEKMYKGPRPPAATTQRPSGLPCPECSTFIPVSMYELLATQPVICPACGLKLHINRQNSARALEALKKVKEAQENLEQTGNKYK